MILAGMIRTDETALICDLAETYGILDYRALPLKTVAALSSGLRDDSRIKLKISGQKISSDIALLAAAVDRLSMLVWVKTKDGQKGRNKPDSILQKLMGGRQEEEDYMVFQTPEDFDAAWKKAINGEV